MIRKLSVLIFVLFAAIISCSDDKNDAPVALTQADIVNNSIISLPSCISAASASKSLHPVKAGSGENSAAEVYEGIREVIGFIDEWTDSLKGIITDIYTLTGFGSQGDWTTSVPVAGEPTRVIWGPDTVNGYEHKVELYWGTGVSQDKGFEAYLTINEAEQTAKGVITWDFSAIDDLDSSNDTAKAQFTFDSTVEPKILEVQVTGLDNASNPDEPDNGWITVSLDENHVIGLSGNLYFPGLKIFDNLTGIDKNYVFTVIGYDETGMDATHMNQAILNLAIPGSTLNLTDAASIANMWSESSVGNIFCEEIKKVWDVEWDVLPNVETNVITAIENWIQSEQAGYDLPATALTFTAQNVIDILEFAASHNTDGQAAELLNLLFVIELVNPAYYMENGFFGTWDGTRGTLNSAADIPASFNDLDISTVSPISPDDVAALVVDFL